MHQPYTPDLSPNDLHIFSSMAIYLAGEELASTEVCENRLSQFRIPIGARVSTRVA